NELNREKLRELAQFRPDDGAGVLSLFLNLDPSEFATPPARETEIRSLIDDAERSLRDAGQLSHAAREGLKRDIARARMYLAAARGRGARPARPGRLVAGALSALGGQGGAGPPQAHRGGRVPPLQARALRPAAARRTRGDPPRHGGAAPPVRARSRGRQGRGG